jgi:hypothetical protein
MPGPEPDLVFRYSREERMKRAPAEVRRMMEERAKGRKRGFFEFLRGDRGMAMIFMTIMGFIVLALGLRIMDRGDGRLGRYRVDARASRNAEEVMVELVFSDQGFFPAGAEKEGNLQILASTDGITYQRSQHYFPGGNKYRLDVRMTAPASATQVMLIIALEGSKLELRLDLPPLAGADPSAGDGLDP